MRKGMRCCSLLLILGPLTACAPLTTLASLGTPSTTTGTPATSVFTSNNTALALVPIAARVAQVTGNSICVFWQNAANVSTHQLFLNGQLVKNNHPFSNFSFEGLTPNTDYTIEIRSISTAGISSPVILMTRTGAVGSRANGSLEANGGCGGGSGGGSASGGNGIDRAALPELPAPVAAPSPPASASPASPVPPASPVAPPMAPPGPPTGLAVVETYGNALRLEWSHGLGATSNTLFLNGQQVLANYTTNHYLFEGLSPNTEYTLGIRSVNAGGMSDIVTFKGTTGAAGSHTGTGNYTGGSGSEPTVAATPIPAPTLTSFTPAAGIAGITVTLTGTDFTGATAVKFNGTNATSFTVVNSSTITAVAPTGVTSGTVAITTPGGTATSASSFTANTWMAVNSGLPNATINGLAIDRTTPTTLYAATSTSGVYRSTDGGTTWSARNTGMGNLGMVNITIDPTNTQVLYAGCDGGCNSAYKSTDGGANWTLMNIGGNNVVYRILVDPTNNQILYAATNGGDRVYKSTDGGTNWNNSGVANGLSAQTAFGLAMDPTNSAILYAGQGGATGHVYKSTNNGGAWTLSNTGIPATNMGTPFVIDPTNTQILYAADQGNSIYKSSNGAGNWATSNSGTTGFITNIVLHPTTPTILYASSNSSGVFKSTNSAANWSQVDTSGLTNLVVWALVIHPTTPNIVYVGTTNGGLFKTGP